MKLIYIYFDFTDNGDHPEGYRGFKKCGFNFGTRDYFKMEEPTQEYPNYRLTCTPRPEDEQIESGFWGDERLYNISAFVGDNGVGKSTIIQEIIRCMMGSSKIGIKDYGRYSHPFVSVWENTDGTYLTFANIDYTEFNASGKRLIHYQHPKAFFLDNSKFVYFSNVLSGSDTQLLSDLGGPHALSESTANEYYTRSFYNCSLTADVAEALKVSGITKASIDDYLDTYFNFRSYQEARFVFDRNQRILLSKLKEQQFPIPFANSITIQIYPAIERFYPKVITPLTNDFEFFRKEYYKYIENCSNTESILAELSLNCIALFYPHCKQERKINFPKPFMQCFGSSDFYIDFLSDIYANIYDTYGNDIVIQSIYEACRNYIVFLWNNKEIIEKYCTLNRKVNYYSIHCNSSIHITLGEIIDYQLTDFMIRFINFTRAVSHKEYFVIYNWGLSSGESNLLHIFTKLRNLLWGNSFDHDFDTRQVSCECAENASLVHRKESLVNFYNDPQRYDVQKCDSVILFFDEADLTLHPEWQRQFVSILAAYLPMLYKDPYYEGSEPSGCKDIQIILSTHSPIMLGDFPSASVIYLKKDENGISVDDQSKLQTFGQNIYTILKEGFYLGEGTVGELARRKIKEVMKDLGDIQNEEERKIMTPDKWISCLEKHQKQTIRHLPKGIIRNKLEEEITKCRVLLGEKSEGLNPDFHLLMRTNKELLEENIRLQKQLAELKNKGQNHD